MNTQKSLLSYESVADSVKLVHKALDGIAIPLGVTPCGRLETAFLDDFSETGNMVIYGLCGSGKSKYIEFLIRSIADIYGENINVSYIDGKDCEVIQYKKMLANKPHMPHPVIMDSATSVGELTDIIYALASNVVKGIERHELVVFDDIEHILPDCDEDTLSEFTGLLRNAPMAGMHVVIAQQSDKGGMLNYLSQVDLVCTTRLDKNLSYRVYGNDIGTLTKKYGEMIYRYKGNWGKLRVPFVKREPAKGDK